MAKAGSTTATVRRRTNLASQKGKHTPDRTNVTKWKSEQYNTFSCESSEEESGSLPPDCLEDQVPLAKKNHLVS